MTSKIIRADGVTELQNIKSVTFTECVNSGQTLVPGCVASARIDVVCYGSQTSAPTGGEALTYYQVNNGVQTKIGVFYAEPVIPSDGTYAFSAYDAASKLDVDYSQRLVTHPKTASIYDIVEDACTYAGVTLGDASWPYSTATNVHIPNGITGVTCRDVLRYAAEIACRYVQADEDGLIRFRWYQTTPNRIGPQTVKVNPPGYKRVQGFTCNNNAMWQITGFHLRGSDTVKISFSVTAACNVFGCYQGTSATDNYDLFVSATPNSKYLRYNGGAYDSYWAAGNMGEQYNVTITPTGTSGMPHDSTWTEATFEATNDMLIGATTLTGTSSKLKGNLYGEIGVSSGGDYRLWLIPVERISDGVLGYYDLVGGVFYEPYSGYDGAVSLGYAPSDVYAYKENGLEYDTSDVSPIGKVSIVYRGIEVGSYGSGTNMLTISDNLFVHAQHAQPSNIAQTIYEGISGVGTWRPATARLFTFENPFRAGDVVDATDRQGVNFWFPVMTFTLTDEAAELKAESYMTYADQTPSLSQTQTAQGTSIAENADAIATIQTQLTTLTTATSGTLTAAITTTSFSGATWVKRGTCVNFAFEFVPTNNVAADTVVAQGLPTAPSALWPSLLFYRSGGALGLGYINPSTGDVYTRVAITAGTWCVVCGTYISAS